MFPQLLGKNTSKTTKKRSYEVAANFIKDTWTQKFCCLSDVQDFFPPSQEMFDTVTKAGCGKKKVIFKQSDKHDTVIGNLSEALPRITQCGGSTIHCAKVSGFLRPPEKVATE